MSDDILDCYLQRIRVVADVVDNLRCNGIDDADYLCRVLHADITILMQYMQRELEGKDGGKL